MTEQDVHGPIDFVLIEFSGDRLTGGGAQALLDLIDRGIIELYDVLVLGKDVDGSVYAVDLEETTEQLGGFGTLAWVRSGLLTEDDMREAAGALEPGRLAVLIVYENTWAKPFVAASREAGGELIASARIPGTRGHGRAGRPGRPAARRSDELRSRDATTSRNRANCRDRGYGDRGRRPGKPPATAALRREGRAGRPGR